MECKSMSEIVKKMGVYLLTNLFHQPLFDEQIFAFVEFLCLASDLFKEFHVEANIFLFL